MAKYIHVVSATKVPENRGSSGSPFEEWETDPNLNPAFGPDERTMFLLVEEPGPPAFNDVLQSLQNTFSPDVDGNDVRGEYIPGDEVWRFTFTLVDNDLEKAKQIKLFKLEEAQGEALAAGYTVGNFVFPFTEDFFRQLADRHYWLDIATNDGVVPSDPAPMITFSDRQGKEVSVTLAQLRNNFGQYGSEYLRIFEKEVDARDEINAANTPGEVDAVTWSF
jgi:hypothetical protein